LGVGINPITVAGRPRPPSTIAESTPTIDMSAPPGATTAHWGQSLPRQHMTQSMYQQAGIAPDDSLQVLHESFDGCEMAKLN